MLRTNAKACRRRVADAPLLNTAADVATITARARLALRATRMETDATEAAKIVAVGVLLVVTAALLGT